MELGTIRFNWHYVIWFRNVTMMLVSLVLPLVLMTYWNLKTLSIIRRRRRLTNRHKEYPPFGANRNGEQSISNQLNDNEVTPQAAACLLNYGPIVNEPIRNSQSDIGMLLIYEFWGWIWKIFKVYPTFKCKYLQQQYFYNFS